MLQLFDNPASPYCRKVKVLAHEAGKSDQIKITFATGHPLAPAEMPLAQNPLGKIPALVRDDGPAIYDSRVICRYLDARFKAGLYHEARIWEVLTLEATGDGIMDAAILMVYEARCRPEEIRSSDWVEAQWDKISRSLDAIGSRWMSHLAGPLDMGHITIGCALGYLDFRHGDRNWRAGREGLAAWFEGFSDRESMTATKPSA